MAYAEFYSSEVVLVDLPLDRIIYRCFNHCHHLYSKAEITKNNLSITGSNTLNRFARTYTATMYLATGKILYPK